MLSIKSHLIAVSGTFVAGALVFATLPANAIERVNTNRTTCAAIQSILVGDGAAVLRYDSKRKPGITLYDRYVGDSRFCASNEIGKWASVPAKDTATCRVIACEKFDPRDFFPFKPLRRPHFWIKVSN